MDIIKLRGTEKKLYELIAPLTLNPAILRQNNNYPFKTGIKYVWYVAADKEQVFGFMPVKQTSTDCYLLDNYYIKGDDSVVLNMLLTEVLANVNRQETLSAVVHKRHTELFRQKKFRVHIEWKNYERMLYCPGRVQAECI